MFNYPDNVHLYLKSLGNECFAEIIWLCLQLLDGTLITKDKYVGMGGDHVFIIYKSTLTLTYP